MCTKIATDVNLGQNTDNLTDNAILLIKKENGQATYFGCKIGTHISISSRSFSSTEATVGANTDACLMDASSDTCC